MMPFNTALLEITFIKEKSRLFQEKIDLCQKSKRKEMIQIILNGMGLTFECPNKKIFTYCEKLRKIIDFNAVQRGMMKTLYGNRYETIKIRTSITHDTGKSCVEVEIKLGLK
ncbi:hypothetical protein PVAND_014172 [Polypedilum vanderplanki]|uniref:Uncharacterized protein n=1 Tax=Polypedilum vanderplanki TaxID=319348 RepID=A0A9J6CSV4_POLVA|nr:hypothetical protein PVAND_014172 [Polypedilum vanderplanki]